MTFVKKYILTFALDCATIIVDIENEVLNIKTYNYRILTASSLFKKFKRITTGIKPSGDFLF